MEEHEKTVNMGLLIIMVIVIIVIFIIIAMKWTEGQALAGASIEFNSLCAQWQYEDCEMDPLNDAVEDALEKIDNEQEDNDKPTLTEECIKLYDIDPTNVDKTKTIKLCQDICKNKCNSQISYDIGVYEENIEFLGENQIRVKILNLGSGSVFGAYVTVTGKGAGPDVTTLFDEPVDISSHETWEKTLPITEAITYIDVNFEDYVDAEPNNNHAFRELL